MDLDTQLKLEAVLFYKGEPEKISRLAKILEKSEEEIQVGLESLQEKLTGGGLRLMRKDDEVQLVTAPETSALIEKIRREELVRDLGKAGVETLAIVVYKGPITRAEIDYIRGVNSNFILRNLLVRGLVERVQNPANQRSVLYQPTFELLSHLGVASLEEMPEFKEVRQELAEFSAQEKQ